MNEHFKPATSKSKCIWSIIFDIAAAICGIAGVILTQTTYGDDTFIYYTNLSNVFAACACIIHAAFTAKELLTDNYFLHNAVKYLKLSAAVCVGITFFVVLTILAPAAGENGYYYAFLWREMIFVHLLCPLFTVVSFVLFDKYPRIPMHACHIALIPTYLYGIISIYLNIKGVWDGPYFFLQVTKNPIHVSVVWLMAVFAIAYLISSMLLIFNGNRLHAIGSLIGMVIKRK